MNLFIYLISFLSSFLFPFFSSFLPQAKPVRSAVIPAKASSFSSCPAPVSGRDSSPRPRDAQLPPSSSSTCASTRVIQAHGIAAIPAASSTPSCQPSPWLQLLLPASRPAQGPWISGHIPAPMRAQLPDQPNLPVISALPPANSQSFEADFVGWNFSITDGRWSI